MIQIQHPNLEQFVQEHYEGVKDKLPEFPKNCKYTLEEVIKATPHKLDEIAKWYISQPKRNLQKWIPTRGIPTKVFWRRGNPLWLPLNDYQFMIDKYKNFTKKKKKDYDAYNLAEKLNINVCPYCNINPTYTVITHQKEKVIRPEFDHFYNKSTYPILALSFYNLIPSCHICNASLKGDKEFSIQTHINPYDNSFDKMAKFRVKIENSTFYYNQNAIEIEMDTTDQKAFNHKETFKLKERYSHHKDTILDLIQKQAIYNESYLDELLSNYEGTLFKNREDLLRLVTCGMIEESEINKRPLSKMIKDISNELGIFR
jgi:hypothetical protein